MEKKQNIKIYLGYKYQVTKISIHANGPDPDEVEKVSGPAKKGICMTKPVNIYNVASVKANVKALKEELEHKFMKSLESLSPALIGQSRDSIPFLRWPTHYQQREVAPTYQHQLSSPTRNAV